MDTETVIRIKPDQPEISVEQIKGKTVSRKLVKPESIAQCFLGSKFDTDKYVSGLLPEGCIEVIISSKEIWYFIEHRERHVDISYYGTEYPAFPLPRLVFAFRYLLEEQKVAACCLCVIPEGRICQETPLYHYPFSNVSSYDGRICLGNNALPVYKDPARLCTLPDYILRIPNNNDHFNKDHNQKGLEYRDLLELLKDKDPTYYYTDILVPNGSTLQDFFNGGLKP